jgi:hypothetical protein
VEPEGWAGVWCLALAVRVGRSVEREGGGLDFKERGGVGFIVRLF